MLSDSKLSIHTDIHNPLSCWRHRGERDMDLFQPVSLTDDYLLPMADTDKITDHFTFKKSL